VNVPNYTFNFQEILERMNFRASESNGIATDQTGTLNLSLKAEALKNQIIFIVFLLFVLPTRRIIGARHGYP
jgi:hypothetical protein